MVALFLTPGEAAMNRLAIPLATAVACALVPAAGVAAPQAYVESVGLDSNTRFDCRQVTPCRSLAAAITVVDDHGEIVAVDAANYGAFAIDRSVTISGNSLASIIGASGAAAVKIDAPGADVVLRGLDIRGAGATNGVSMTNGHSLSIERNVISDFPLNGVLVNTPASVRILDSVVRGNANGVQIQGGGTANVVRSAFLGNKGAGLMVNATVAATSAYVTDSVAAGNLLWGFGAFSMDGVALGRMAITRSTASNNGSAGFQTSTFATISVSDSMSSGNAVGFANIPGVTGIGTFETFGDNTVIGNGIAATGIITPVAKM
jgi:nitrous oxidase accessory protein NosD